jgi:pantothenate kinase
VYFSREAHSTEPGGRLNFLSFETDHIRDCVEFMKHLKDKQQTLNGSRPGELCIMATGGGAYKYHDMIRDELGVDVHREDEMECLIIGMSHLGLVPELVYGCLTLLPRQASISSSPRYPAKSSPTRTRTRCTSSRPRTTSTPTS